MGQGSFNFESYHNLLKAIRENAIGGDPNAKEDAEFVEGYMKNFLQYVHAVFTMEVESWIAGMQLEGKNFQDKIMLLDGSRSRAHEAAIASANAINRIAATYEISPIFEGNGTDRYQVADCCLDAVVKVFQNRKL